MKLRFLAVLVVMVFLISTFGLNGELIFASESNTYDLVIKNGRVIDPETNFDAIAHVGIIGNKIAKITTTLTEPMTADEEIDATGLYVFPGFIDVHSHALNTPGLRIYSYDGVTTILDTEAGLSPYTKIGNRIDKKILNYGGTVGYLSAKLSVKHSMSHGPGTSGILFNFSLSGLLNSSLNLFTTLPLELRTLGNLSKCVTDAFSYDALNEPLTANELKRVRRKLEKGLNDGALGIGLLLDYMNAGVSANSDELKMIFEVAGNYQRPIFTHIRRGLPNLPLSTDPHDWGADDSNLGNFKEMLELAKTYNAPLQISHLEHSATSNTDAFLTMIDDYKAQGVDISVESMPWSSGGVTISAQVFSKSDWQERFDNVLITDVQLEHTGVYFDNIQEFDNLRQNGNDTLLHHYVKDEYIETVLQYPDSMIISDGTSASYLGNIDPNTRGIAPFHRTNTMVLAKYVKQLGVLTLNDAIKKMTLLPAKRFEDFASSFKRKGRIQVGCDADIAIFDYDNITLESEYYPEENNTAQSWNVGQAKYTIVNGVEVVSNGVANEDYNPGQLQKVYKPYETANLALTANVTASSNKRWFGPQKAIDGKIKGLFNRWKTVSSTSDHWLKLDFGTNQTINRWVVKHAGSSGLTKHYNTEDFRLEKSSDGITWTTVDTVNNSSENTTDRVISPFTAQYVRLFITKAQQGSINTARIVEFQLFNGVTSINKAKNQSASANHNCLFQKPGEAVDGNDGNKWRTNQDLGQQWLKLNLGKTQAINRYVIKHAGAGIDSSSQNTKHFIIQKSENGTDWTDVDEVKDNDMDITERKVETFYAKYVRLFIVVPEQGSGDNARIFEFELYEDTVPGVPNLAFDETVTANSYDSSYLPENAVNGSINDKWVTSQDVGAQWLMVDLGEVKTIDKWLVKHAQSYGESIDFNTKNFKLQASVDGTTWEDVDVVTNNNGGLTERTIEPIQIRYARLYITTPDQMSGTTARIYEFELYNTCTDNLAAGMPVSVSSEVDIFPANGAVNGAVQNVRDAWRSETSTNDKWLMIDLKGQKFINNWVVKHSGFYSPTYANYNTKDFKLQSSHDGITWTDVDSVTNNSADVTDRYIPEFYAQYVRLYITNGNQLSGTIATIYEFELYHNEFYNKAKIAAAVPTASCFLGNIGDNAIDSDASTKWISGDSTNDKWLKVDFGSVQTINNWVVKHAESKGEDSAYNTKDFKLQKSEDGTIWTDVDSVTGNTDAITDKDVDTFESRYVRLYITTPSQGTETKATIYEFEVNYK